MAKAIFQILLKPTTSLVIFDIVTTVMWSEDVAKADYTNNHTKPTKFKHLLLQSYH